MSILLSSSSIKVELLEEKNYCDRMHHTCYLIFCKDANISKSFQTMPYLATTTMAVPAARKRIVRVFLVFKIKASPAVTLKILLLTAP